MPDTASLDERERNLPLGRGRTFRWPRMRPRFIEEVACRPDRLMTALRETSERSGGAVEGRFSERHGVIDLPDHAQQFWSTHLGLTIEARGDHARVLGIFSPHPAVWTAYVFAMGMLALFASVALLYSVVQISLGASPWALVVTLVAALFAALLYTSTLVGQGLAADEMYLLRRHLDACIEEAEQRAATAPATSRDSARL